MWRIPDHLSAPPLSGEIAVLDRRTGEYHLLNASAAAIWRLAGDGMDAGRIAGALAARHDAPVAAIRADVDAAIADLCARGLLFGDASDSAAT